MNLFQNPETSSGLERISTFIGAKKQVLKTKKHQFKLANFSIRKNQLLQ
jgi:hypothetical protein